MMVEVDQKKPFHKRVLTDFSPREQLLYGFVIGAMMQVVAVICHVGWLLISLWAFGSLVSLLKSRRKYGKWTYDSTNPQMTARFWYGTFLALLVVEGLTLLYDMIFILH